MTGWTLPWVPGAATGVGPFPGSDPFEAARVVAGELPDLPHLCELPHRGAGADAAGRTASLLVDIHVDVHAGRWRVVSRPSGDERRAREMLERDLDALEDVAGRYDGPLKIQWSARGRSPARWSWRAGRRCWPTPVRRATWPSRSARAWPATSPTSAGD